MCADPTPFPQAAHWTQLWRTGVLHSCSHGIEGNYDGELRLFWERNAAALPQGARVLDVGTGNGAIALLIHRFRPDLQVVGTDLADVDPRSNVVDGRELFSEITFLPRTPMHAIPLADGSVDLIASQYAFEYAAQAPALQEFFRLVGSGGRIALILHSTHSEIARISVRQAQAITEVLRNDGIFDRAEQVIQALDSARASGLSSLSGSTTAEQSRLAFNEAASALVERALAERDLPVLGRSVGILQDALGSVAQDPPAALRRLQNGRAVLAEEAARLQELMQATRSEDEMKSLVEALYAQGMRSGFEPLMYRGVNMGWALEAVRE
ncbi:MULTISPECIES: class I SAM-dependent methyltransferase [Stenotrophomonas]|nr:class I SAM-dependent methyltransferase [Stenotrophomonas maltophilia]